MIYLVTGGSGSLGTALTRRLLSFPETEAVRIFSRGECRQAEMAAELSKESSRLRFLIGDVRDPDRLAKAMHGVDCVIHAAALKRIEVGEYNPDEFVKTNVQGSMNVVKRASEAGVPTCVLISTDKAVDPVNTYGATKMLAERIFSQAPYSLGNPKTRFAAVRYGNVLGSRGSVLTIWKKQIVERCPLSITDPIMTRFVITLEQAVDLVLTAISSARSGDLLIPILPSCTTMALLTAFDEGCQFIVTGTRPGEKLHECLIGVSESHRAEVISSEVIAISPLVPGKEGVPREKYKNAGMFSNEVPRINQGRLGMLVSQALKGGVN